MCGLKPDRSGNAYHIGGHTLRGCVDWNGNWSKRIFAKKKSHPAWVCGLKPSCMMNPPMAICHTLRGCVDWNRHSLTMTGNNTVTPCVGVWIETPIPLTIEAHISSHPAWVCGLKQWRVYQFRHSSVTPCVGVWIETYEDWIYKPLQKSHPAWVCGLKQYRALFCPLLTVTPCVGVWIETSVNFNTKHSFSGSHPAWVCGLKLW